MQTENGGFWDSLEEKIESMALVAGPIKGGAIFLLGHLVLAPATEFLFLFLNNLLRGTGSLRKAVQGAVLMFGVNARRYEHGNRDVRPLERISAELNAGNGVGR